MLTSFLDFWLLGGTSLFIFLFILTFEKLALFQKTEVAQTQLFGFSIFLAYFFIYPHYFLTYKLAYKSVAKGKRHSNSFFKKNIFFLFGFPLFFLVSMIYGLSRYSHQFQSFDFYRVLNSTLLSWGYTNKFGQVQTIGQDIFAWLTGITLVLMAWHLPRQGYYCFRLFADLKTYPISRKQDFLLKIAFLTVSGSILGSRFYGSQNLTAFGLTYYPLFTSLFVFTLFKTLYFLGFIVVSSIFYFNYKSSSISPPLTLITIFLAVFFWWNPVWNRSLYIEQYVPIFHGLQFLAMSHYLNKTYGSNGSELKKGCVAIFLVLFGFCFFDVIPYTVDHSEFYPEHFPSFQILVTLFMTAHHCVLNGVIWKAYLNKEINFSEKKC